MIVIEADNEAEEEREQFTKMRLEGKSEGSRFKSIFPAVANFVLGTDLPDEPADPAATFTVMPMVEDVAK